MLWLNLFWKGFLSLLNGKSKIISYSLKISIQPFFSIKLKRGKVPWVFVLLSIWNTMTSRRISFSCFTVLWKGRGWDWAINYTQVRKERRGYRWGCKAKKSGCMGQEKSTNLNIRILALLACVSLSDLSFLIWKIKGLNKNHRCGSIIL